jgi:hypothetical protein
MVALCFPMIDIVRTEGETSTSSMWKAVLIEHVRDYLNPILGLTRRSQSAARLGWENRLTQGPMRAGRNFG